ncbi:FemAB family PEP-CTERM system-associated protein [Granulosicoccus sp.]|nr:FemAB family XrtA/PEP-CTERM system-associated protein [Granulosicoccus sp.]MDB4224530.1 FemAB family PEP-CTERM system-associated protein [Granulosicoccus sp.]
MNGNSNLKDMHATLRKELRKTPNLLIEKIAGQLNTSEAQANVRLQLQAIVEALALETEKMEDRKAISRQIGIAKKANQNSEHLIEKVSSISVELDEIKDSINDQISIIEAQIAKNTEKLVKAKSAELPLHLQIDENTARSRGQTQELSTAHVNFDLEKWQYFVDSTEHSTIYHDPRWKQIIEKNFKHFFYTVTCVNSDGKLVGVLPLVHLKSRQFGSFTLSMPYFNYGGPLAETAEAEQALMTHAARLSDELGCSHMEIRETRKRTDWQATQRKVSMILPLPDNDISLEEQLGSKLRAQVNKARKHGVTVAFGGIELLDSYYRVFSRNMRDLGTPVYSKTVFKDILETFPDNAFIAIASLNGTPLASGFLIGYKDKLEIPWASSVRSKNHLGANMLMYREILKEAIHRNYRFFDFGRSTKEATTHRFKKQWGAKEHKLHWHYWTRGNEKIPELNPGNPKFRLAIKLWQLLPVAVTRLIGPPIARNLP